MCPSFWFQKKRKWSLCLEESQGMWKYCISTHFVSVSQRVFLPRLFWYTQFPYSFWAAWMQMSCGYKTTSNKPARGNTCASHLTTALLQLTTDIDLISLYDLDCFSDIQHKGHLDTRLPWPLVLYFVVFSERKKGGEADSRGGGRTF